MKSGKQENVTHGRYRTHSASRLRLRLRSALARELAYGNTPDSQTTEQQIASRSLQRRVASLDPATLVLGDCADVRWVLYNPASPTPARDARPVPSTLGSPPRWRLVFIFAATCVSLPSCSFTHLWYNLNIPGIK